MKLKNKFTGRKPEEGPEMSEDSIFACG